MRQFKVFEFNDHEDKEFDVIYTEEDIRETYYEMWCSKMRGLGFENEISFDNFIKDWMEINWAEEIT